MVVLWINTPPLTANLAVCVCVNPQESVFIFGRLHTQGRFREKGREWMGSWEWMKVGAGKRGGKRVLITKTGSVLQRKMLNGDPFNYRRSRFDEVILKVFEISLSGNHALFLFKIFLSSFNQESREYHVLNFKINQFSDDFKENLNLFLMTLSRFFI